MLNWPGLLELQEVPGSEIIFTPSGTYSELYPLCLALGHQPKSVLNIIMASDETGTGTVYAAKGLHFQNQTPLGVSVEGGTSLDRMPTSRIALEDLPLRDPSGNPLSQAIIDRQVTSRVVSAIKADKFVLVHILDSSKTGLGGPALETVIRLKEQYDSSLMVLVDAAQMRLGNASLHHYLANGCLVLITGSKFFTGPPLSGALLVPSPLTKTIDRLSSLPVGLKGYCTKYDLPPRWAHLTSNLSPNPNVGLLLRWKAALWEMTAFYSVPLAEQYSTLRTFEESLYQAIQNNPDLELIPSKPFERSGNLQHWEDLSTIFSFFVKKKARGGTGHLVFTSEECRLLYRWLNRNIAPFLPHGLSEHERMLASQRCHIGQPVRMAGGTNSERMALRLASGARLVAGVHFHQWPNARLSEEIQNAKLVLEKLSLIVRYWEQLSRSEIEQENKGYGHHSRRD